MMPPIKIITPPHTLFAARHLVSQLKVLGYSAAIATRIAPRDTALHIIYNAAAHGVLPANYIVYQTEVPGSKWFNKNYFNTISRARAVFDYHPGNISAYTHLHTKIAVVPPGIQPMPAARKDIPVLFYGWLNGSPRRQNLLAQLQQHIPVKIVTAKTGTEMWRLLARARVVVNLHYYPNAPLELFRINEALSHQCHVVSEYSTHHLPAYNNLVHYHHTIPGFAAHIKTCLHTPFNYQLHPLDNLQALREGMGLVGQ